MFGESSWDQRDFTFGLAGLLAGIHSLRILAERGIASPEDIQLSVDGIRATMKSVPAGMLADDQLVRIDDMLGNIYVSALQAWKSGPDAGETSNV